MNKIKDEIFFKLVRDFLLTYLPKQRNYSQNTIRSYQKGLDLFFEFVKNKYKIKLSDLTFEMLNKKILFDFLEYIENERCCSINTRNQRLNCIRSFFSYATDMNSTLMAYKADIAKVPLKQVNQTPIIQTMSENAVHSLLEAPNLQTAKGIRDQLIMAFLYDTGGRVQEIANIKLSDLSIGKVFSVRLHGKGGKNRPVPIQKNTVQHLKQYMKIFHPDDNFSVNKNLFYVIRNQKVKMMTEDNIRKLLKHYAAIARLKDIEIPDRVHPHLLRHARAMHLYKYGMDLTMISEWLGHSNLETTQIYASADTEMKRKASEKSLENTPISSHVNQKRFTVSDEDVLKQLMGLK